MDHDCGEMDTHMVAPSPISAASGSAGAPSGQHQHEHLGGMMKMYLHFGLGDLFLLDGLVLDSSLKLYLACLACFLGALLLEAIDYSRSYFICRCELEPNGLSCGRARCQSSTNSTTDLLPSAVNANQGRPDMAGGASGDSAAGNWSSCCATRAAEPKGSLLAQINNNRKRRRSCQLARLVQGALQFVRTGLSFGLMLAAMTYNVCIVFAILAGAGLGFYIFYRPALEIRGACH